MYHNLLLNDFPSGLFGYWIMKDPSGATCTDSSVEANNGTYSGVTLANAVSPQDGTVCPSFDGVNDNINVYSAALNTDFQVGSGAEYTFGCWAKVSSSAIWTDAAQHNLCRFQADASNRCELRKTTTNNQLSWITVAGGTTKQVTSTANTPTDWFFMMVTNSKAADQVKAYYNGVQIGSTQTALGTWTGALASTSCILGATSTGGSNPWGGWMAHFIAFNRALSAAEVYRLYVGDPRPMNVLQRFRMRSPILRR